MKKLFVFLFSLCSISCSCQDLCDYGLRMVLSPYLTTADNSRFGLGLEAGYQGDLSISTPYTSYYHGESIFSIYIGGLYRFFNEPVYQDTVWLSGKIVKRRGSLQFYIKPTVKLFTVGPVTLFTGIAPALSQEYGFQVPVFSRFSFSLSGYKSFSLEPSYDLISKIKSININLHFLMNQ